MDGVLMGVAAVAAVRGLVYVLKESLRLQGARGLELKRARSGDTLLYQLPELKLNICMVSELFVQILATGIGVLAFVWATVVLLGGFSILIPKKDFWVITGIIFIQAARVVGLNVSPEAKFFNQVPPAFLVLASEHYTMWGRQRLLTGQSTNRSYIIMLMFTSEGWVLIMMAFLAILVLLVKLVAGSVCISLSIYRLVELSSQHDKAFVFHALILFYALVLFQGGLFIIWLRLRIFRSDLANRVSLKYGLEDKRELIDKYMDKTMSTAMRNGLSGTINRNLASFAADLMKSDYCHDHIDAVLMIHTLTSQTDHRTRTPSEEDNRTRTLSQIQSSLLCVSRLFDMVNSKSCTDHRTKICIAEIVAHIATNLRLADISGAMESISSLIHPNFPKVSTPATSVNNDHETAIDIPHDQLGSKPLIIHGLLILAKLAVNPDNMEIAEKALEVVSMLVSGTDETNGNIRRDICSNKIAVNYIQPILKRGDEYSKIKIPATKILTELYLDMFPQSTTGLDNVAEFIKVLKNIFFDAANESGLRKTTGKALAALAMENANCMTIMDSSTGQTSVQLLTMIFEDNGRLYQTSIAQLLMQICANSDSNATGAILRSVKPNLMQHCC